MFARVRSASALLTLALALLLTAVPSAGAVADGTYTIVYTAATGTEWSRTSVAPFATSSTAVSTNNGAATADSSGALVFRLQEGGDLRLGGGTVTVYNEFQGSSLRAFASVERDNGVVIGSSSTPQPGRQVFTLARGGTVLRVGMRASSAVANVLVNKVTLERAELVIEDPTAPTIASSSLPDALTWVDGTSCVPVSVNANDAGSGLAQISLRRTSSQAVVDAWSATLVNRPRPGVDEKSWSACIPGAIRDEGTTGFEIEARDVGGLTKLQRFSVRTDRTSPTVEMPLVDGSSHEAPFALPGFTVDDAAGSGVRTVTATLNGATLPVAVVDGAATVASPPLLPGAHELVVRATDAVGNVRTTTRHITVVDTVAPVLSILEPGARGAGSAVVRASATDGVSGVDHATWSVQVNGTERTISVDAGVVLASFSNLAPGTHRIVVRVADAAGNLATQSRDYVVDPPANLPDDIANQIQDVISNQTANPGSPNAAGAGGSAITGGTSPSDPALGAWIVRRGPGSVVFGASMSTTVFVARSGQPVQGRRIVVQRYGAEIASATTGADGLATATFAIREPGSFRVIVDGITTLALPIDVTPKVTLGALPKRVKRGAKLTVRGAVSPGQRGWSGVLEGRVGKGGWFVITRKLTSDRRGAFVAKVSANAAGAYQLRIRVAPRMGWKGAQTNVRAFRVS